MCQNAIFHVAAKSSVSLLTSHINTFICCVLLLNLKVWLKMFYRFCKLLLLYIEIHVVFLSCSSVNQLWGIYVCRGPYIFIFCQDLPGKSCYGSGYPTIISWWWLIDRFLTLAFQHRRRCL